MLRRIRRSRVVPTPRRWRSSPRRRVPRRAGDGGNKARSPRRARSKPSKPLRREGRIDPPTPVVTNSCVFYFTHEAAGAAGTRLSLRPPFSRDKIHASLGRDPRRGKVKLCLALSARSVGDISVIPDGAKRRSGIPTLLRDIPRLVLTHHPGMTESFGLRATRADPASKDAERLKPASPYMASRR
jgi:hypothetical protein